MNVPKYFQRIRQKFFCLYGKYEKCVIFVNLVITFDCSKNFIFLWKVQILKIKIIHQRRQMAFGKECHLWVLAESFSHWSIKLNEVSDDVFNRKCYWKTIWFMLFHLKRIPKRLHVKDLIQAVVKLRAEKILCILLSFTIYSPKIVLRGTKYRAWRRMYGSYFLKTLPEIWFSF